MALEQELDKLVKDYSKKVTIIFNANIEEALKKGGSKNVQQPNLRIEDTVTASNGTLNIKWVANEDYYYWLDKGRKPGKQPPSDKLGKSWQTSQKIDPRKVIQELTIKYNKSKGLKRNVKMLSFDKAAKQLSFIIARSIGKNGYKPRPFIDQAIKEADIEGFKKKISELMQREITIEFKQG